MTGKKIKNPKAHIKLCMKYEITVMINVSYFH